MSVQLLVQLPSHSFIFQLSVPSNANVLAIKQRIESTCPGRPRVDGQRIIHRGKVLKDDEEVGSLFLDETEVHTVHLAVHPSAWTGSPPCQIEPSSSTSLEQDQESLDSRIPTTPQSIVSPTQPQLQVPPPHFPHPMAFPGQQYPPPLEGQVPSSNYPTRPSSPRPTTRPNLSQPYAPPYINFIHANALRYLSGHPQYSYTEQATQIARSRDEAKGQLALRSLAWPDVFDRAVELYFSPPPGLEGGGVVYEAITLDGHPYLRAADPTTQPTPSQELALKILTHTFPLLTLPPVVLPPGHPDRPQQIAALADMFLGPARAQALLPPHLQQPPPGRVIGIQINLRPLIVPLFLLTLRTTLLLYFFSPARRPLFGAILGLWVGWEVWVAIRGAIQQPGVVPGAAGAGAGGVPPVPAPGAAGPMPNPNPARGDLMAGVRTLFTTGNPQTVTDHLALINLPQEEAALFYPDGILPPSTVPPQPALAPGQLTPNPVPAPNPPPHQGPIPLEPGLAQGEELPLFYRMKAFLSLFFLTLHPAVWERRREALRDRELRIRVAYNQREEPRRAGEGQLDGADGEEREGGRTLGGGQTLGGETEGSAPAPAPEPLAPRPPTGWAGRYVQRVQNGFGDD